MTASQNEALLNEELLQAARAGNNELVTRALQAGADINAQHEAALKTAAKNGHISTVELLLEHKADLYGGLDKDIMYFAASSGKREMVELFERRGVDIRSNNDNALTGAALSGNRKLVDYMLASGLDVHANGDSAVLAAAGKGHLIIVKRLVAAGADMSAGDDEIIINAVDSGSIKLVGYLLDNGVDVNAHNAKALYTAAAGMAHRPMYDYLLSRGADLGAPGNTILADAITAEYDDVGTGKIILYDMIQDMLARGVYIHSGNEAALREAARCGNTSVVAELLKRGADVHALDDEALQNAARNGFNDIVLLLLENGADVHAADEKALKKALSEGYPETALLLMEHGGKLELNFEMFLKIAWQCDHNIPVENDSSYLSAITLLLGKGTRLSEEQVSILKENFPDNQKTLLHLLDACGDLQKITDAYAGTDCENAAVSLVYQTAQIGAELGYDAARIVAFVNQVMESNDADINLSPIPQSVALHPAVYHQFSQKASHQLGAIAGAIGDGGYLAAQRVADLTQEFTTTVLLPHMLLEHGFGPADFEKMREKDFMPIYSEVGVLALHILFAGKRTDEILTITDEWHRAGNAIPDSLRPLRGGTWQPLINDVTFQPGHSGDALVISALTTQKDLSFESSELVHCVGRANYGAQCMKGSCHILSIRKDGIPMATLEIKLSGSARHLLRIEQFVGKNDSAPPPEAREAWRWFEGQINSGNIVLNKPRKKGWGEIPEHKPVPPLIKFIGFVPSKETVDACVRHYHDHLLYKENRLKYVSQSSGGFVNQGAIQPYYEWKHALQAASAEALIRDTARHLWRRAMHGVSEIKKDALLRL